MFFWLNYVTHKNIDVPIPQAVNTFVANLAKERHYIVTNLSALLVNSRNLPRTEKQDVATCVLRSNRRMALLLKELVYELAPQKPTELTMDYLGLYWQFIMNDLMLGDNFLVEIFRDILLKNQNKDDKLAANDLLIACCEEEPLQIVDQLSDTKQIHEIVAVYIRLVTIYYFRCHRPADKKRIRKALKELRKLSKNFILPAVT